MKMVLLAAFVAALVAGAGYYGVAHQIAQGFMVLSVIFAAMIILGSVSGGVRISGPRPVSPHLQPRVRRGTAA